MYPSKIFFAGLGLLIWSSIFVLSFSSNALESASFYYIEGAKFLENGQPEKAAEKFERAFNIGPNYEKIHYSLGVTLIRKLSPPDPQRLIKLFTDPDKSGNSRSGSYFYWLGIAYETNRDYDNALDCLEKAKEIESEFVSQQEIQNAIQLVKSKKSPVRPGNNHDNWWKNFIVLAGILAISFLFIFALNKWVLEPKNNATPAGTKSRFDTKNILIFVLITLVLVFSALAVGWINSEQFTKLIEKFLEFFK